MWYFFSWNFTTFPCECWLKTSLAEHFTLFRFFANSILKTVNFTWKECNILLKQIQPLKLWQYDSKISYLKLLNVLINPANFLWPSNCSVIHPPASQSPAWWSSRPSWLQMSIISCILAVTSFSIFNANWRAWWGKFGLINVLLLFLLT